MTDAELKKSVVRRLAAAREAGLSIGKLARICPDGITLNTLYDMLSAQPLPMEVWHQVDETLTLLNL